MTIPRVRNATASKGVMGFPTLTSDDKLQRLLNAESSGFLGFGQEEQLWQQMIWLPFYMLQVGCSKNEQSWLGKVTLKVTPIWNVYNGLDGSYYIKFDQEPKVLSLDADTPLLPKIKERQVRTTLNQVFEKRNSVVTPNAKERYDAQLTSLGIPWQTAHICIDSSSLLYMPFYIGCFRRRGKDRIAAVNAHWGEMSESIARILTTNLSYVVAACGQ
jgi:hypothetical protein